MIEIEKIKKLAKDRKWGITYSNFCEYNNHFIIINRLGLRIYKNEYRKQILTIRNRRNINLLYNGTKTLKKVDNWLVEVIRKYIPETNNYTILLQNSYKSDKYEHYFPPLTPKPLK